MSDGYNVSLKQFHSMKVDNEVTGGCAAFALADNLAGPVSTNVSNQRLFFSAAKKNVEGNNTALVNRKVSDFSDCNGSSNFFEYRDLVGGGGTTSRGHERRADNQPVALPEASESRDNDGSATNNDLLNPVAEDASGAFSDENWRADRDATAAALASLASVGNASYPLTRHSDYVDDAIERSYHGVCTNHTVYLPEVTEETVTSEKLGVSAAASRCGKVRIEKGSCTNTRLGDGLVDVSLAWNPTPLIHLQTCVISQQQQQSSVLVGGILLGQDVARDCERDERHCQGALLRFVVRGAVAQQVDPALEAGGWLAKLKPWKVPRTLAVGRLREKIAPYRSGRASVESMLKYTHRALELIYRSGGGAKFEKLLEFEGSRDADDFRKPQKPLLVLDLDQTLICNVVAPTRQVERQVSRLRNMTYATNTGQQRMHLRPHAKDFLRFAAKHFRLYIFTAASATYCEELATSIEEIVKVPNLFLKRFSRENTVGFGRKAGAAAPAAYLKVLRGIVSERQFPDTLLMDDNPVNFLTQPDNCVFTEPYVADGRKDSELLVVKDVLKYLLRVREIHGEFKPGVKELYGFREWVEQSAGALRQKYRGDPPASVQPRCGKLRACGSVRLRSQTAS